MKTEIFENYVAFIQRDDKTINGVSKEFADANPGWDEERGNKGCWNCSDCSGCSRCSDCSGCSDCSRCSDCSGCSRCSDCSGCSDCSRCSRCSRCSGLKENKPNVMPEIPVIPNIHQAVRAAIEKEGNSLNMSDWHTCETTHCRAGWVVALAGAEGKRLEEHTNTEFAAKQIYKASSPIKVPPTRFYETNEKAMKDIVRCAEEEAAAAQ